MSASSWLSTLLFYPFVYTSLVHVYQVLQRMAFFYHYATVFRKKLRNLNIDSHTSAIKVDPDSILLDYLHHSHCRYPFVHLLITNRLLEITFYHSRLFKPESSFNYIHFFYLTLENLLKLTVLTFFVTVCSWCLADIGTYTCTPKSKVYFLQCFGGYTLAILNKSSYKYFVFVYNVRTISSCL